MGQKIIVVDFDYPQDYEQKDVNIPNDVLIVESIVCNYTYIGTTIPVNLDYLKLSLAYPDYKEPTIDNIGINLTRTNKLQSSKVETNIVMKYYNAKVRLKIRKLMHTPAGTSYPKLKVYLICKTR